MAEASGGPLVYNGKRIEVLFDVDVVVVGGGFPGICAALAASRAGARTALVERDGILGGQAAGIDTWGIDGFVDKQGKRAIRGIPWEILRRTVALGGSDPLWERIDLEVMENRGIERALRDVGLDAYVPYIDTGSFMNPFNDQYVNPNAYRYVAHCMLEEASVEVLLEAPAIDVVLEGNAVRAVVVQCEFAKYAVRGRRFVDTSQNAILCAHAGFPFGHARAYMGTLPRVAGVDVGRMLEYLRGTDEPWFVRPMAGKRADPDEMEALVRGGNPLAVHGFMTALEKAIREDARYAPLMRRDKGQLMFFYERDGIGAYWTFGDAFDRVDADDPRALSRAICAGRKQQWIMHDFFRRYIPGFERAHLMDVYPHISKAYLQSMEPGGLTEYDVSREEMVSGVSTRSDGVVKVLGHPRAGQCDTGWTLPLASFIPRGLEGIVVTGKPVCRKVHYLATCAMVGQAAGVIAALSAVRDTPLRRMDAAQIRSELAKEEQGGR